MSDAMLLRLGLSALPAAGLGLFAAGHAASWGAFKDSPFEGFRFASYVRTFALGALIAVLLSWWLPASSAAAAAVLVGATYALERLATEWWKSIVRNDDQAAFTIPMRLGLFGRPIERRATRYSVGAIVVLVLVAGVVGVHLAQSALPALPWLAPVVGSLGGWATAAGGAWKDAPIEGFSPWKFLRSPAVATAWSLPLSALTSDWSALLLASAGYAVVTIETYKTFFTRGRPPGKFAGKPIRARLPRVRRVLAMQNAGWWVVLAALLGIAAAAPHPVGSSAVSWVALAIVGIVAVLVASAVLRQGPASLDPVESDVVRPSSGPGLPGVRCVVVVPTYNEAATISGIIEGLLDSRALGGRELDVLVVDDDSPDGTGAIVGTHHEFGRRVRLLSRGTKDGLGAAYRAGFAAALEAGYDVIIQMDADGSHPAAAIPAMLDQLATHDLVIGSRYVPGGATRNWPLSRRALSWAANTYARNVLRLRPRDVTSGFRAWRSEALDRAKVLETGSNGYGFQVENTWRADRARLRVAEYPITFVDRAAGTSKMSAAVAAEALLRVLQWRTGELVHGLRTRFRERRAPATVQ